MIFLAGAAVLALLIHRLTARVGALERALLRHEDERDRLEEALLAARRGALSPAPAARPPASALRAPPAPRDRSWIDAAPDETGPAAPEATEADHAGQGGEDGERETVSALFERWVGGRLLVWIGGIALAVGGVFLVRQSIDLVTPPVRMAMAAAFGLLLVAAAEYARSRADGLVDPRTGQALAGAGIFVLYAATYGSWFLYALLSAALASALMALVTAAALVLSLRHGAPTAVMGLAGGFATPLLVGDPDAGAVPLLGYLALLNVALFAIAHRRGWTWLAAGATILSFAWTAALLFSPVDEALASGLFIVALAVAASLAPAGPGWQIAFLRPAAIGLFQLAILVARTDLGAAAWGLFGLLALACYLLAPRRAEYRFLPALAFALALALLAAKAATANAPYVPEAGVGILILFAAASLPRALKGRLPDSLVASAAFAGPAIVLRLGRPDLLAEPVWGAAFALLALGPLALAWHRSRAAERPALDFALLAAAAAAALLLAIAAAELLPERLVGSAWLLLALGAALAARRLPDRGLGGLAAVVAGFAAFWTWAMAGELWLVLIGAAAGDPALAAELPPLGGALLALLPAALLLFALARVAGRGGRGEAEALALAAFFAAAAAYLLFKQLFALQDHQDFVVRGFAERTLLTQFLFLAGWAVCTGRVPLPAVEEGQRRRIGLGLTALAAARLVWFDMLLHNPVAADQWVGSWPLLNLLLPAYLLSALWLYLARRSAPNAARSGLWLVLALASLAVGTMLLVRQLFHGAVLTAPHILASESYGYSLAGLLLSVALLLGGIRLPDKALRVAGLALLTATILKVFLSDASALEGVLRILSFLGLGVALIGVGKLYTRILATEARPAATPPAQPSA